MKRTLRTACIGAGVLALLAVIAIGVAATLISPNDFKPQIEALVLKATGKRLILHGDLSLSLFPRISITAGPAELAADPAFGPAPLLRVNTVSASVSVMPLLSGMVEIGTVSVSGVRVNLVVDKAGTPNWELPPAAKHDTRPAAAPQQQSGSAQVPDLAAIKLDKLAFSDIALNYKDMRTGEALNATISQLDLNDVAVGGKTTLSLAASVTKGGMAPIVLQLKASFSVPRSLEQDLPFAVEGTLDKTPFTFKGTATLPGSGRPFGLTADITAGAIVLDKYTTAPTKGAAPKPAPGSPAKPAPGGDASPDAAVRKLLHALALDLRIRIASLTVAGLPVTDIAMPVTVDKGLLTAAPIAMTIAGGPLTTNLTVDARDKAIRSRVSGNWKNARVGELARIVAGQSPLTGTLGATWDVAGVGFAWPGMARTLAGKASFALTNGAIPAFKIASLVLPGLPAAGINLEAVQSSGSWNIAEGIARNNDFELKATGLTAEGRGDVSIPAQTVNYKLTVHLPLIGELPAPTKVTVLVTGPLAAPAFALNQADLLRDTAKNLLNPDTKTGKEIRKGIGSILDGLRRR